MELHLGDADDLISFARMLEEESDDLCKELGIEGKHIEAQEAELAKTIERTVVYRNMLPSFSKR